MKLAAMEGLYEGSNGAGLIAVGVMNPAKKAFNDAANPFLFKIEIPKMLSLLGYRDANAFVPGVRDLVEGGYTFPDGTTALSFSEKRERGQLAIQALADYQRAKEENRDVDAANYETVIRENYPYFGYGYLQSEHEMVPNIPLSFYGFHLMVIIGLYFILFFIIVLYFYRRKSMEKNRWLLYIALWSIPLAYIASQLGWMVAEVGRQPWTIQDVLPVRAATSAVSFGNVMTTFILFAVLFTALLIAEVTIMVKEIKKGPAMTDVQPV